VAVHSDGEPDGVRNAESHDFNMRST